MEVKLNNPSRIRTNDWTAVSTKNNFRLNKICFGFLIVVKSVRMAKEPEQKATGDGKNPVGSLSDYVSGRLSELSQRREEAEVQAAIVGNRQIELFLQRTAMLRAHLQELANPIDEALTRFQARGLLEEAGNILNSHKNLHNPNNFSKDYQVVELRPRLYRHVVTKPEPTDSNFKIGIDLRAASEKEMGSSWKPKPVFKLADLTDPGIFKRLIPTFNAMTEPYESYGFALTISGEWPLLVAPPQDVIWSGQNRRKTGWSPGAGDIYRDEGGFQVAWSDQKPSHYITIKVTKSLSITGIDTSKTLALWYRHRLQRVDMRGSNCDYNQSLDTTLTGQGIQHDDPVEVLQNFIGNDVARELDGEFKDLLHQYSTDLFLLSRTFQ